MRVILLGLPGAGKGTQAQKLQAKLGVPLIVMGDILRSAIEQKTPVGIEAEKYVSQGKLAPDSVVIEIVKQRLKQKDTGKGFLLDGFPRTSEQAKSLEQELVAQKRNITYVIYYGISDAVALQRICGRRICKKCGAIYHIDNHPPKTMDICDACGNKLTQRKDDTPEVIRQRLQDYHRETAPLLQYYGQRKLLLEIPAERSMEEILQDTLHKLKIA
jgi:adenylate kinase